MKAYPLEIENIGEDVYILISRGHHDIHDFMRAVREQYDWPLGVPQHIYMKTRPARPSSDYLCFYDVVPQGTRGAWPATHVQEAWGEDSYESFVASSEAARTQTGASVAGHNVQAELPKSDSGHSVFASDPAPDAPVNGLESAPHDDGRVL